MANPNPAAGRIVGGAEVNPQHKLPYQVHVQVIIIMCYVYQKMLKIFLKFTKIKNQPNLIAQIYTFWKLDSYGPQSYS